MHSNLNAMRVAAVRWKERSWKWSTLVRGNDITGLFYLIARRLRVISAEHTHRRMYLSGTIGAMENQTEIGIKTSSRAEPKWQSIHLQLLFDIRLAARPKPHSVQLWPEVVMHAMYIDADRNINGFAGVRVCASYDHHIYGSRTFTNVFMLIENLPMRNKWIAHHDRSTYLFAFSLDLCECGPQLLPFSSFSASKYLMNLWTGEWILVFHSSRWFTSDNHRIV